MSVEIGLTIASGELQMWAAAMVQRFHYLRTVPDPRCRSLTYVVSVGGNPVGCLWFGRPQAHRCYQGELTYGSLDDIASGRAKFDRWEVLDLSRVWFDPTVQPGGSLHGPDHIPGFVDRKGVFRSTLATSLIDVALRVINHDYLYCNPPCFVEQPYKIRAVLSYCDTRIHRGVIYRAAGFQLARTNRDGIQTWWTDRVVDLTDDQDTRVRERAAVHPRSVRIRERGWLPLFDGPERKAQG